MKEKRSEKRKIKKSNTAKAIALSQIASLIIEIFAFSFIMGAAFFSDIKFASAEEQNVPAGYSKMSGSDTLYKNDKGYIISFLYGQWTYGSNSRTPEIYPSGCAGKPITCETNTPATTPAPPATALAPPAGRTTGAGTEAGVKRSYAMPLGGEKTFTTPGGYLLGNMIEGLTYSAWIFGLGNLVSQFIPDAEQQKNVKAFTLAIALGTQAGYLGRGIAEALEATPSWSTGIGWVVGLTVTYLIAANNYKKTTELEETIEFKCMAWQAPLGGKDCTKCNGNPLKPCSEYRCRALGQTCKLVNAGTGFDRCIDSSPNDVTSPGIKPWGDALTLGYKYTDVVPRPPGSPATPGHMKITSESGGCLKAFTPFEFGITTTDFVDGKEASQPARCKIDFNHTAKMDDMDYWMGEDNMFVENHSQRISMPGTDYLNKAFPEIKNDGEYTLYIRCGDGNGNENRDEFAVRFCIDKTPDTTAPVIKSTSPLSGSAVLYKVDNASANVYVNEPSNCRWSRKDASYSNMENAMQCNKNVWEMNAELYYTCTAKLTSIKDKSENTFYFRCADMNNNTMQQGYEYKLFGTQPLTILEVKPNGTIGSSTSISVVSLEVKTDNGFSNGESTCYFSTTGVEKDYIAMAESGGNTHKQNLDLSEGSYTYYFKCVDAGGNAAYNSTNFNVYADKYPPIVIRAYNAEGKLIIITDEESKCRYSTDSCNFDLSKEEGQQMPYDFDASMAHFSDWLTSQTYFIKCLDKYNNQPNPAECSAVLRPYKMPEDETF